ncbi:outer membrane beta-barrel protein [Edaphobacter aggregans]|uniref:outer membrane beta-barrel protein n=1 Tax=Edaphobacter aggregans TaxID=570835 RepID=UPI001FE23725|nr:outer membrane beta-barrel protein [Edaphobacter aggregans]
MKNHIVCRIAASLSGAAVLFGVLLGGGRAFAQGAETGPADAATKAAAAAATTDQRIDALQQTLEEIQKQLLALKQARTGAQTATAASQPSATPAAAGPAQPQVAAHAVVPSSASSSSGAGPEVSAVATAPVQTNNDPNNPHSEPFAFADFTWLTGNARTKDTPYATAFFTPEIRVDANYTYDFRHPKDDTISGSSEVFRSNEVQLTQFGVGGDFHYDNVRARLMTQFGMYSQTTPRNDASPARGQWNLDNAYRYVSEAYGGYHFNVQHGINVDAGIFMSYVGLFSYYQFDNWAYQPSYVSSNTPWFFNGVRVQWFPTAKLKIEPWFINGWQSYGRFNSRPGFGGQILWRPNGKWSIVGNQYAFGRDALGVPKRTRYHTDDSIQFKYYDRPTSRLSKMAMSLTGDLGCETGGGVSCFGTGKDGSPKQSFVGFMAYNRFWFDHDRYAMTIGGGRINNAGRYLVLLPPINGATAASGTPYFTENPGDQYKAWDVSWTADYMPSQYFTYRLEYNHRAANVPYFSGPGGVTPPGGNTFGAPGSIVEGWTPDLRKSENRMTLAFLVKF